MKMSAKLLCLALFGAASAQYRFNGFNGFNNVGYGGYGFGNNFRFGNNGLRGGNSFGNNRFSPSLYGASPTFTTSATAAVPAAQATNAPVVEKEHIYYDGETELYGHLMYQDTGATDRAGLLIFPYFMGAPALPDRDLGRKYAEKGMVVFVADYYGKKYDDSVASDINEALNEAYPALTGNAKKAQKVAKLALDQLTSVAGVNADRVGVIGFCMGGQMAAELSRAGGKAQVAVSLHGSVAPVKGDKSKKENNVKYFATFYGRNDPLIPPEAVEASQVWLAERTSDGNSDHEVTVYSNTVHGFSNDMPAGIYAFLESVGFGGAAAYSEKRAKSAFERIDSLFQEYGLI